MKQPGYSTDELIRRLQNDTCTPEELKLLREWIAGLDIGDLPPAISPEVLIQLKKRMHEAILHQAPAAVVVSMQRRNHSRWYMTAAAVIVVAGTAALSWYWNQRSPLLTGKKTTHATIINNNQQVVRKITLPDGTQVWLNRHSRLEFDPAQYNTLQRYVKLTGEGFFDVVSNASKPFIVETGNLRTRVIGTAFNIEAYSHESEIRVALVRGKIVLNDTTANNTTMLVPNQTVRYSKQTKTWQVLPTVSDNIEMWTRGHLVFNEVPLQEALQRIAARYELDIVFDIELLRDKRITATLFSNSWQSALRNVLFVHGLSYTSRQNKIFIVKNSNNKNK